MGGALEYIINIICITVAILAARFSSIWWTCEFSDTIRASMSARLLVPAWCWLSSMPRTSCRICQQYKHMSKNFFIIGLNPLQYILIIFLVLGHLDEQITNKGYCKHLKLNTTSTNIFTITKVIFTL